LRRLGGDQGSLSLLRQSTHHRAWGAGRPLRRNRHALRGERRPILILQDTTEFIYSRAQPGKIGFTKTINAGRYKAGQPNTVTLCGVLLHASLAVTLSGTPLGLTAAKLWTRTKFKGTWTLKRHVNPTRVPIETKESYRWLENLRQSMALVGAPERCVHVADRESDIYELFCLTQDLGTRFVVRVQTDRLAGAPSGAEPQDKAHRVFAQLSTAPWAGRHIVTVGQGQTTCVQVKFASIETLPPIGKQKRYSPQPLTYIRALEVDPPADRPPIDWKLVTNLPVDDCGFRADPAGHSDLMPPPVPI